MAPEDRTALTLAEAMAAFRQGRDAEAHVLAAEVAHEGSGADAPGWVDAFCMLARVALRAGDHVEATTQTTLAMQCAEESGDHRLLRLPLHLAAAVARLSGDLPAARLLYRRSIALNTDLGVAGAVAAEQRNLAYVELHLGDAASALDLFARAHSALEVHGTSAAGPEHALDLAAIASQRGDADSAAQMLEEAVRRYDEEGRVPDPDDAQEITRLRRTGSTT